MCLSDTHLKYYYICRSYRSESPTLVNQSISQSMPEAVVCATVSVQCVTRKRVGYRTGPDPGAICDRFTPAKRGKSVREHHIPPEIFTCMPKFFFKIWTPDRFTLTGVNRSGSTTGIFCPSFIPHCI